MYYYKLMNAKTEKKIQEVKETVKPVLKKYGAVRAGLFGSIVRGEMKKGSDIDMLIELPKENNISLLGFIHIKNEITDVLGRDVDLVEYHLLKKAIEKEVLNEEIRIL